MKVDAKRLAYFGNQLERHGLSRTGIDYLSALLSDEFDIVTASHERNQFLRLLDMIKVLLRNQDRDFVLIDTYSTRAFHFASALGALCRWLGIPYIPILHGGDLESRLNRSPKLTKALFGNAYRNVAPSRFLQAVFQKHDLQACVIPNPLDLATYEFTERRSVEPRLLYVRSFAAAYNPSLAIRVLKRLHDRNSAASLCMVGPDKDGTRTQVENLAHELGVHSQVRFTGKLAPETWRHLSKEYDIFVNTTNVDNTPVSVVEAMALGLPVVSTSVGGLPYLINHEENGLLVAPGSEVQFVESIERLVGDPALVQALTRNGREKADTFSAENVKKQWGWLISGSS